MRQCLQRGLMGQRLGGQDAIAIKWLVCILGLVVLHLRKAQGAGIGLATGLQNALGLG